MNCERMFTVHDTSFFSFSFEFRNSLMDLMDYFIYIIMVNQIIFYEKEIFMERVCAKCNSTNHVIITEDISQRMSPLMALVYIGLLFIPVIGWIAFFIMLTKRPRTKRYTSAVCQVCGNKEVLSVV